MEYVIYVMCAAGMFGGVYNSPTNAEQKMSDRIGVCFTAALLWPMCLVWVIVEAYEK